MNQTEFKLHSPKLYPSNTILIALYGATAGKVSLLSFEACSNQAVCGVILNDSDMLYYTKLFLSSLYDHFIMLSTGSARDNISQDIIKNTNIIVPSNKVLVAFNIVVKTATEIIVNNLNEIKSLTIQREELLQLLINGQVLVNSDLLKFLYLAEKFLIIRYAEFYYRSNSKQNAP